MHDYFSHSKHNLNCLCNHKFAFTFFTLRKVSDLQPSRCQAMTCNFFFWKSHTFVLSKNIQRWYHHTHDTMTDDICPYSDSTNGGMRRYDRLISPPLLWSSTQTPRVHMCLSDLRNFQAFAKCCFHVCRRSPVCENASCQLDQEDEHPSSICRLPLTWGRNQSDSQMLHKRMDLSHSTLVWGQLALSSDFACFVLCKGFRLPPNWDSLHDISCTSQQEEIHGPHLKVNDWMALEKLFWQTNKPPWFWMVPMELCQSHGCMLDARKSLQWV